MDNNYVLLVPEIVKKYHLKSLHFNQYFNKTKA